VQYKVTDLAGGSSNDFFVSGWSAGSVAGKSVKLYQRLASQKYGSMTYSGMELVTDTNYETSLQINDGVNSTGDPLDNSRSKDNFLVRLVDAGKSLDELFGISSIDGVNVTLAGDLHFYGLTGSTVSVQVYRYVSIPADVGGVTYSSIYRSGPQRIANVAGQSGSSMGVAETPGYAENVSTGEGIHFKIEYTDGTTEEGKII
jgi:hypothetical protein